jgi:hypothetical protein
LKVALLTTPGPVEASGTEITEANLLAGLVRECAVAGIGRRALLLRLSRLPPTLRRPQHLRLARAAIDPLVRADRARLFSLPGDDLAVVWRGEAEAAVKAATGALVRLFEDEEIPAFAAPWELFQLPEQAERLLSLLRPETPPATAANARNAPGRLDIATLTALEHGLAGVDVASFVRRRRVCAAGLDGRLRVKWDQRFLSITDLAETLAPDRSVQADPWLYRRLTRTLDQRMLALLAAPQELRDAGPFSVALNTASILSPSFLRFDAALPTILRGHVVIELLPADVLGDLAAFMFARDFARERGYRLLLRDMNAELLPVFPLDRLSVDLLQMPWTEALGTEGAADASPEAARMLLTGIDSPEALAWARERGVGFLQGRLIEPG